MRRVQGSVLALMMIALGACSDDAPKSGDPLEDVEPGADTVDADVGDIEDEPLEPIELPPAPPNAGVHGIAGGCFRVEVFDGVQGLGLLQADASGERFVTSGDEPESAARFRLQPADLATYLLYDEERHYLVADRADLEFVDEGPDAYLRAQTLDSAFSLRIDGFIPPSKWTFEVSERDPSRFQLLNVAHGQYLAWEGLTPRAEEAAILTLFEDEGCADFPELTVDAIGDVVPRMWDDGDLFGIVDAHSHLFTNTGFGGGGMFHGAPFHALGVEHALPDCTASHGEEGRRDIVGFFYDGDQDLDVDILLPILSSGRTPDFNHHTDGYPTFTDWPNAVESSTHQVQYYRWLERAYRGGLRLVVELATSNSVLCDFMTGLRAQTAIYSCNDMVGADRQLVAVRELERYIDALHGGPGEGWFRIVETPQQARDVIASGKLAVVLGIETSNLFDCFLTPPDGVEPCTPERVNEQLDSYYERGVRVVFPVHKYDNAFAPGDGSGGIIEIGNFINTGHYSNFVEGCPFGRVGFDNGDVTFGGLNRPRDQYDAPPVVNMSRFANSPVPTLLPFLESIIDPTTFTGLCQQADMTPLGEHLMHAMIERGMIIDIAHLPQRAAETALQILEAADYPASSTHGVTYNNRVFEIGGFVGGGFGRCADLEQTDTMGNSFRSRVSVRESLGLHPGLGVEFDLNGFAGQRRPRFGDQSRCPQPQPNPITYPFRSYDDTIEFTHPWVGERQIDYNTEGFVHIGMLPEMIQELRLDGMSDEDLAPLFRSAEAWVRMWELAESRAEDLR